MSDREDGRWHVDRKIPIALIVAISLQTGGAVWWGATTSARLEVVEKKQDQQAPQADRLTRVEVKLESIKETLDRIERTVRRETPSRR